MKKLLIISTVLLSSLLLSNELSWVDEQIEAIKPARSGMNNRTLSSIQDPFIFFKKSDVKKAVGPSIKSVASISLKKVKRSKQVLTLMLIMNNTAMINDTWYKKGEKINGYEIKALTSNSVLLAKNKKQLLLSTKSNNKNLKFNNK